PGSFTPLIRIETENGEREKAQRRSLAEKLQQEGSEDGHGVVFRLNWCGCWTDWRKKSGQTA
ncbi:putative rhsD, partial [Escherichia coli PA2]